MIWDMAEMKTMLKSSNKAKPRVTEMFGTHLTRNPPSRRRKAFLKGIKGRWKGVSAGQVMDMMSIS